MCRHLVFPTSYRDYICRIISAHPLHVCKIIFIFLLYQISTVWNKSNIHIFSCTKGVYVRVLREEDPEGKSVIKCKL